MNGKEIKEYITSIDDIEYNVTVFDECGNEINFNDIQDDVIYEFNKIGEFKIGSGIVKAYYSIKK